MSDIAAANRAETTQRIPAVRSQFIVRIRTYAFRAKWSWHCSFRDVPGLGAHREWRVDAFVVDRHAHARRGVRKDMAVEHPDPRVVGFEGDVPSLARRDQHRVHVDRSASQAVAVLGQDREDMAVDVDRVELRAVVDKVEANQLPLANADWGHEW